VRRREEVKAFFFAWGSILLIAGPLTLAAYFLLEFFCGWDIGRIVFVLLVPIPPALSAGIVVAASRCSRTRGSEERSSS